MTSLVIGDLRSPPVSASSSANILSSRDVRWLRFFFGVVVLVTESAGFELTFSKRVASFGEANAFNCFPRFRMVSWHSANFSEAAVISQSYKVD